MKKFEKYICVFCVIVGFIAAYVIGYKLGNGDAYNRNDIDGENNINSSSEYNDYTSEKKTLDVSKNDIFLDKDATLVLETCNESDKDNVRTTESSLPIELIGLTREKVIEYLEENTELFGEKSEDIISIMLVSFSSDRIVVRKNVRDKEVVIYPNGESERYNYYVAFDNNKVIVYKKDKETVFIETGITYDMLERETRELIEKGVWIENISTLYRYLESITS